MFRINSLSGSIGLQNENNSANVNSNKNQLLNQPSKSAFKDLTNAKGFGSTQNNKNETPKFGSNKAPLFKKHETKQKESISIYLDDYYTTVPKYQDKFEEFAWAQAAIDTAKEKIDTILDHNFSDCSNYEEIKADEFPFPDMEHEIPSLPDFDNSFDDIYELIPPREHFDLPEDYDLYETSLLEFSDNSSDNSMEEFSYGL